MLLLIEMKWFNDFCKDFSVYQYVLGGLGLVSLMKVESLS